ncbi:hypothetical protein D3H65_28285 [Paraflavitalea soli]|uniref:Restriction endonuclease type IV Mrr domain-containing protein n=1 Tax=Paraflavitalea soli TaxID=2315862 RepID=A0A3B7MW30_9BACT|nr:restriction endonuclease [Paraflavitalea soli]AXY77643.1 hypothetical protein D3H65_28285 [Paraflavitalea soli]
MIQTLASTRHLNGLLETLSYVEFEQFVADVLIESGKFSKVERSTIINNIHIDIIAHEKDTIALSQFPTKWFFEVKKSKLVGLDVVYQLLAWFSTFQEPNIRVALITMGHLSLHAKQLAKEKGITVLGLEEIAQLTTPKIYKKYFGGELIFNPTENEESQTTLFADQLLSIKPGREEWSKYQKLISDIFELLFIPPLESPRYEHRDREADNRRDMIFENSATIGFWKTIKDTYEGHYIVVDAKNYSEPIEKKPILEIAHYLKPHGCGMFGIIACRKGLSKSSKSAIREQWIGNKKLIVVINDNDLLEMLKLKNPEEVIRRKIADFRIEL